MFLSYISILIDDASIVSVGIVTYSTSPSEAKRSEGALSSFSLAEL